MEKTKKCEICGAVKPVSDFSKSYRNRCKSCVATMTRENRIYVKNVGMTGTIAPHPDVQYIPSARFTLIQSAMVALIDIKGVNRPGLIAQEAVEIADAVLSQMIKTDPEKAI